MTTADPRDPGPYPNDLETAPGGRVRSDRELRAISRRYKDSDRWTAMSGTERVAFLRNARAAIARDLKISETKVTREQLAKFAGVAPGKVGPHMLTLAGDFSPLKKG